jgi:glycosyltransferase involved in cell wall biosynthesis
MDQITYELFMYSIIVVDNDRLESARDIVSEVSETSPILMKYYAEHEQNISLARNMAVHNATGDYIAFIDDDEIPENQWLLTLYNAIKKYKADGILGPVKPLYEEEPPDWIVKGKFYDRPSYATGLVIDWKKGRTGNVLLKINIFSCGNDCMFDPAFGSGAEDQDFFRRQIERGRKFVWCNEAVAYEYVSPTRWKRNFMLKRALVRGRVSLNHPTTGLKEVVKSIIAIPLYTFLLPILLLLSHHLFMRYLIAEFDHLGRVLSLCGIHLIKQKYVIE